MATDTSISTQIKRRLHQMELDLTEANRNGEAPYSFFYGRAISEARYAAGYAQELERKLAARA